MIGRKQSLTALRKTLESLKDVSIRCTNILHGKTTRWLLAWTFHKFGMFRTPSRLAVWLYICHC